MLSKKYEGMNACIMTMVQEAILKRIPTEFAAAGRDAVSLVMFLRIFGKTKAKLKVMARTGRSPRFLGRRVIYTLQTQRLTKCVYSTSGLS